MLFIHVFNHAVAKGVGDRGSGNKKQLRPGEGQRVQVNYIFFPEPLPIFFSLITFLNKIPPPPFFKGGNKEIVEPDPCSLLPDP